MGFQHASAAAPFVFANDAEYAKRECIWNFYLEHRELVSSTFIGWPPGDEVLKAQVFLWVCQNPGKDAKDVSRHFAISGLQAVEIVEELLNEGLLDFGK